jgi:indole-3-glycerol phosphate synthase
MKRTDTVLDKIIADKRAALDKQKQRKSQAALEREVESMDRSDVPGFFDVLKRPGMKTIAEVKQASPSAGLLRQPFDPAEINQAYQSAEAVAAISVITEEKHFQGSPDTLAYFAAHNKNRKPLLRKDFIFDEYQILESRLLGAQAYLLIAALFDAEELGKLVDFGLARGIEPLVEVHDQAELGMALRTKARCIGVNARDLKDFSLDAGRHQLLRQLDDSYARVAESAIDSPEYLKHLADFADAALIGTAFMKSKDIAKTLEAFE